MVFSLALAQEKPASPAVNPFRIAVPDKTLLDLRDRLARTRWPDQIKGTTWEYGVPVETMKDLVRHWQTGYDWRAEEEKLNARPQFTTKIDGLDMHFLHVRSKEKNAVPLVLVHGWPGSFVEFYKILGPLTDPVAHGGKAEDAFHVVCPSLPGFGFSSMPKERGWSSQRMAEVIAKLMARLGYEKYLAQGGDWGGGIVRWMAGADGGHCLGAHSNFPSGGQPMEDPMRGVTAKEMERLQQRKKELGDHYGYSSIQGTRPLTIGYALNDSPTGLAAWIVDKFWAWSDHGGNLFNSFTRDELITNVMVYWVTESMPSSTRIYFESSHPWAKPESMAVFQNTGKSAPMGFALFPKEINVPPRAWVERNMGGKLFHWTEMTKGGHFAAMEQPGLLAEDIRLFARKVREGKVK
ncbi:MAG: epoxide hydrolase [Gemmataceae bacterium]|nr:epoxide hydrolase [Gemmataceae bacterium]